jgi:spore maturation protein CgeB
MRIQILDTYYALFLSSLYARVPELGTKPYDEQLSLILDECFGTSDFYSSNLKKLGHEATEVVVNCEPLQRQWALEHHLQLDDKLRWTITRKGQLPWLIRSKQSDWFYKVLARQIKEYRPDVLYVQDMNMVGETFIEEMKPYCGLIAGQIACPIKQDSNFRVYDYITSSFPHFVDQFRKEGIASDYLKLGFDPRVLEHNHTADSHQAVFVGSLSVAHQSRIKLLEMLAADRKIEIWGSGIESLSKNTTLHQVYHEESWALDMYSVLRNSKIALNHHIDLAGVTANNMRLFEATGVGTMLLTDWKINIGDMFEPGKEVVTYRSPEECVELLSYYLSHEVERATIARAGQLRTLNEHTYFHRMQELSELLAKQLSKKRSAVGAST